MFDRFTERARKVMSLSREVAQSYLHDYIGTEHLLHGLVEEGSGVGAQVLARLDVDLRDVGTRLEAKVKRGRAGATHQLPFVPRAKKALEFALEEAQNMGHTFIGTAHLLLGLIREGEGIAAHVLADLGVRLDDAREEVLELLGDGDEDEDEVAPAPALRLEDPAPDPGGARRSRTPALDVFGRDITAHARQGELSPFVGREREIERLCVVLSRHQGGNPLLVGAAGVGKRAIIEGLAQRIVADRVPPAFRGRRLVTLDLTWIVGGAKYQGQLAERVAAVLRELRMAGNVILHLADVNVVAGREASAALRELSLALRTALHRGELTCIAAMTPEEHDEHFAPDAALSRHFQVVRIDPLSESETLEVILRRQDSLERHHGVRYEARALRLAVELAATRLTARPLPLSALDVVDDAGAHLASVLGDRSPAPDEAVAVVDEAAIRDAVARLAGERPDVASA